MTQLHACCVHVDLNILWEDLHLANTASQHSLIVRFIENVCDQYLRVLL